MYSNFYDPFSFPMMYRQQPSLPPIPPFGIPPFGGQTQPSEPPGPPPSAVPRRQDVGVLMVDPGAIRPCKNQFVYLWMKDGSSFWAYLLFVGPRSVAGFRWLRRRWVYFGTDLKNIESFVCY